MFVTRVLRLFMGSSSSQLVQEQGCFIRHGKGLVESLSPNLNPDVQDPPIEVAELDLVPVELQLWLAVTDVGISQELAEFCD